MQNISKKGGTCNKFGDIWIEKFEVPLHLEVGGKKSFFQALDKTPSALKIPQFFWRFLPV